MTKISICDVCNKDGKIVKSKYRLSWRHGIKVDLCKEHKDFFEGKNQSETIKLLLWSD